MSSKTVILVTGVPGTGKTTISQMLTFKLNGIYINLTDLVKNDNYTLGWDNSRATAIADIRALRRRIYKEISLANKPLIVDGHFSTDMVRPTKTTLVVVLRRAPWVLKEELKIRGYGPQKISENIEAELLGICLINALDNHDPNKVCELDTTRNTPEEVVEKILDALKGKQYSFGHIDWMDHPEIENMLRELRASDEYD